MKLQIEKDYSCQGFYTFSSPSFILIVGLYDSEYHRILENKVVAD